MILLLLFLMVMKSNRLFLFKKVRIKETSYTPSSNRTVKACLHVYFGIFVTCQSHARRIRDTFVTGKCESGAIHTCKDLVFTSPASIVDRWHASLCSGLTSGGCLNFSSLFRCHVGIHLQLRCIPRHHPPIHHPVFFIAVPRVSS